jgi:N-acetylmuramoyl-L-alanine amidase
MKYLIIHCSDTPNHRDIKAEDIHRWHLENGWDGIGYNMIIERSHCRGHNTESIGICLIGRDEFIPIQMASLESQCRVYKSKYPGIKIVGHNELDPHKTCPNFDVQKWIETVHW